MTIYSVSAFSVSKNIPATVSPELSVEEDYVERQPHETGTAVSQSRNHIYNQPPKFNHSYNKMLGRVVDLNDYVMSGVSSDFIPELDKKFKEITDELEFSALQATLYAGSSETKSDKEIQQGVQELIESLQKLFMDPFMTAADKMTAYYNSISTIRDLLSQHVGPAPGDDDNKGDLMLNMNEIVNGLNSIRTKWSVDNVLYPINGDNRVGVSRQEAEDWCAKMGIGDVVPDILSGTYRVVIDMSPLKSIVDLFMSHHTGLLLVTMSQVEYNNIMSSLDSFLQKEQGKMNKIVNQLDYYNKLINQVQEQLTDFFKRMCEVANNFLRV